MDELKRKYEKSMRDVLHILGKYDYQYIKEYVENLEKTFIQLEQNYDSLWDSVHSNSPLKFEELKVGMWVWDNKRKEWCALSAFWKDALNRYYISGLSDSPFEENRFYRKRVMEE